MEKSQTEIAEEVGIKRSHLSDIENDKLPKGPGVFLAIRIANALQKPVEDIFFKPSVCNTEQRGDESA
jgi:DNA-binding XRE family transcriptional regulator